MSQLDEVRHTLTKEERALGAKKSHEIRRHKTQLREAFEVLLAADVPTKDGKQLSGNEALALKAFQAALKGDWKAWELVRDTSGQKPVDKIMLAEVEPEVINEVERMVAECKDEGEK